MTDLDDSQKANSDLPAATTQWLIDTLKKNAPTLNFSHGEKYFTYNVPDYLKVVDLCDKHDGHVIVKAPLTQSRMHEHLNKASSGTYLFIPEERDSVKNGDLKKTAVYVHAVGGKVNGNLVFDFQYFFFYAYNGTATLSVTVGSDNAEIPIPGGAHQGDWESVIVRTDTNGAVIGIYCNQHGSGTWYGPGELKWTDGHPNIYVAKSGHPSYIGIGEFATRSFNHTFTVGSYDIKIKLINETSAGGATLPTAEIAALVATDKIQIDGTKTDAPWWLDYLGRYGRVVFTEQEIEITTVALTVVLTPMITDILAPSAAKAVAKFLFSTLGEIAPDGPEAPKAKGWWNMIVPDGPWELSTYRWSGNERISIANHHNPQSDSGPAMAVDSSYNFLHMAYKGAESSRLYSAFRTQYGWQGNLPIKISNKELTSRSAPGMATYEGKIYLVYRHEDTEDLFYTCFYDRNWQGNHPIAIPGHDIKSSGSPSVVKYDGGLHIVYVGKDSDTLRHVWFDGAAWHGGDPITEPNPAKTITMKSRTHPALVACDGVLHMFYVGVHSGEIYSAWFDGHVWKGNRPIQFNGRTTTSSGIAPSAAVVDGDLMIFFVSQPLLLPEICWAIHDSISNSWYGAAIGAYSSIQPMTLNQPAVATFDAGLVMVYTGALSHPIDFYQAEFTKWT